MLRPVRVHPFPQVFRCVPALSTLQMFQIFTDYYRGLCLQSTCVNVHALCMLDAPVVRPPIPCWCLPSLLARWGRIQASRPPESFGQRRETQERSRDLGLLRGMMLCIQSHDTLGFQAAKLLVTNGGWWLLQSYGHRCGVLGFNILWSPTDGAFKVRCGRQCH